MPGDLGEDPGGQLALMDALVFFAIAMLLSSALLVQVRSVVDRDAVIGGETDVDAGNMLEVLMAASIGRSLSIPLEKEIVIARDEPVSECVRAELYALISGTDLEAFDGLNEAVADILDVLSGPSMRACLVASLLDGPSNEPLLVIPGPYRPTGLAYASSMDLPCADSVLCRVLLLLEPAFPP